MPSNIEGFRERLEKQFGYLHRMASFNIMKELESFIATEIQSAEERGRLYGVHTSYEAARASCDASETSRNMLLAIHGLKEHLTNKE